MTDKETETQTVFEEKESESSEPRKSTTGMEENVAALLCYLAGFVTGIVFIVIEKENKFVRFHAMQSIITFAVLFVASFVLSAIPILGWILAILLTPFTVVIWAILMMKAYKGTWFKLPIVGNIAEQQINKMDNREG